jgi:archaellum component FlaC
MSQVAPFFAEMEQFIEQGRATIAAGQELSLVGLDENIDRLCTLMMELSQEERMMYENRLQDLLGGLNTLGNELREQVSAIQEIPQHRNATIAYQRADSRDNFGIRDGE